VPVGDEMHVVGQDGVALAKCWLEATGRFQVRWHTGDDLALAVPYLSVEQADRMQAWRCSMG
jgi:hypothetical protein